jgi:hypothetical protein
VAIGWRRSIKYIFWVASSLQTFNKLNLTAQNLSAFIKMNRLKRLFSVSLILVLLSCNHHNAVVYFNDNSKVDDGEIFGEGLHAFFSPDQNIYVRSINNPDLQRGLREIVDSLIKTSTNLELDDGYYGYAFVTSSRDTLFANYSLTYWKLKQKRMSITNAKVTAIVRPIFQNPYLK